ncbi:MAG: T9SS type A sorting domain-containing protein [Bacteroidales bacterium]|nr:T9SS type A sorting domain-containing protein [Bacteroidales bacterium]
MKKLLFTIIASVVMFFNVTAQNVARECVLFEVFTGVNCPYCPAAAMAVGKLLEEGKSIAPVAFHTNAFSAPEFYTNETNLRANYYYISSYPTMKVDGVKSPSVGGQSNNQEYIDYSYNQALTAYNQRISVTSPFELDLSFSWKSGTQFEVKATANKVGTCSSTDVRVFIALTESHIQRSWQGMSELNFVVRDMIPTQNGTQMSGDYIEVTETFDIADFDRENCELVAWVQSYNGTKEVFQAVKLSLMDSDNKYDMAIRNVEELPLSSCSGMLSPRFTFKNYGTETLNSAMFVAKDENGTELASYLWEGSLAKGEAAEFDFPAFDANDAASVTVEAMNLNGSNEDAYIGDNVYTINLEESISLSDAYIKIQLKTGDDPENFRVEIKNMTTGDMYKTLTFEDAKKVYTEEVTFPAIGCYSVSFINSEGNGMNGGFWGIKNSSNQTLVSGTAATNAFRYEVSAEFYSETVGVEDIAENQSAVYPNPANNEINVSVENMAKVTVYNSIGQKVFAQDAKSDVMTISTESMTNGIYYVTIETTEGATSTQKIVVSK